MEQLTFEYYAKQKVSRRAHVGVAGSGDLEILIEPCQEQRAYVVIRTRSNGFGKTWKAVLDRFFTVYDLAVSIEINDFGATPGVVSLRLAQAVEVLIGE
ncbi:malonate decarboxylase subunit delta [Paenibacillus elgii]